jgi:hypothetical protein
MIFDSTQFLGFIACKNAKTIIRNLNRNIRNHPHSRALLTGLEHLSHNDSKQSGVIWDGKEGIRATKVLQKLHCTQFQTRKVFFSLKWSIGGPQFPSLQFITDWMGTGTKLLRNINSDRLENRGQRKFPLVVIWSLEQVRLCA